MPTGVREYTRQHKYLDDGRSPGNGTVADSYTVTALITDDDLDEDQDQARVTVVNVGPGLSLTPSAAIIDEGQSWSLQIELDEPGILDEHELFVDWGDGQSQVIHLPAGQTTASLAHTYVDDNPTGTPQDTYSILVEVTDDDLGYSVADAVVEVRNVPPAIALTLSQAVIQEGDDVLLTGTIQDPGVEDSFSVLIDWGGTQGSETLKLPAGTQTFSARHRYLDDGPSPGNSTSRDDYTIRVDIQDDDTGDGGQTTALTVENVAPVITHLTANVQRIADGFRTTVTGNFEDVGSLDEHVGSIAWGTGQGSSSLTLTSAGSFTAVHEYRDPAEESYSVTITMEDDDRGQVRRSLDVPMDNVPPAITGLALDATVIDEGDTAVLRGTFDDPNPDDTHTVFVNWGDGRQATQVSLAAGVHSFVVSHPYADDDPSGTPRDDYGVTVIVLDEHGASDTADTSVTVRNVDPVVTAVQVNPTPLLEGQAVALTISFTDPGLPDLHIVQVTWSDGQTDSYPLPVGQRTLITSATPTATMDRHPVMEHRRILSRSALRSPMMIREQGGGCHDRRPERRSRNHVARRQDDADSKRSAGPTAWHANRPGNAGRTSGDCHLGCPRLDAGQRTRRRHIRCSV